MQFISSSSAAMMMMREATHGAASCSHTQITSWHCHPRPTVHSSPPRLQHCYQSDESFRRQNSNHRVKAAAEEPTGSGSTNTSPSANTTSRHSSKNYRPNGTSKHFKLVNDWPATSSVDESLVLTKFIAETLLPTRHGKFRLRGYKHSIDGGITFTEPTAMICGQVEGLEDVPLRVHDACFTSEVLGSLKCDCAEQLALALEKIQANPPGLVIYLQQEGRGIGLANKIAAYSLQEQGLDTVDANRALGLPDDCREYSSVRNILTGLGVKSVQLITNNPRKMSVLASLGVRVTGRIPCLVDAGEFNQGYLDAKRDRMDHMLLSESDDDEAPLAMRSATRASTMALPTNAASPSAASSPFDSSAGLSISGRASTPVLGATASTVSSFGLASGTSPHPVNGGAQLQRKAGFAAAASLAAASAAAAEKEGLNGQFSYWNHDGEPTQPVQTSQFAPGGMGLPAGVVAADGKVALSSLASQDLDE